MKKSYLRYFVLSLIILCSSLSYLYLSALSAQQSSDISHHALSDVMTEQPNVEDRTDHYLPDIHLIRKVLELGRKAIQVAP